jgi:hypothetical protein
MLSEQRIRELAIRWYFIALNGQHDNHEQAHVVFSKANAFIHVLDYPSDINCSKKSTDGLKAYAKSLFDKWLVDLESDPSLVINLWLTNNVKIDFENHI